MINGFFWGLLGLCVAVLVLAGVVYGLSQDVRRLERPEVRFVTLGYNDSESLFEGRNGFFVREPAGYFCVETHNRSADEIARTTMHELAHYFTIDGDPGHFAGSLRGLPEYQEEVER